MTINNVPNYAYGYRYWVFSIDRNYDCWFYGAYDSRVKACDVAVEVKGHVTENPSYQA